jgi:hypothetical protein
MRAIIYSIPTLLITSLLTLNVVTAQNSTAYLASDTKMEGATSASKPANTAVEPVVNEKSAINTQALTIDSQKQTLKLNYPLPAFTYSAVILIQDFTGRTLKTINANPHDKIANEFYINDLLSGTYNYTLILDNQKKLYGEFIVKD